MKTEEIRHIINQWRFIIRVQEKGGGLKGMFKKATKSAKEAQPQVCSGFL